MKPLHDPVLPGLDTAVNLERALDALRDALGAAVPGTEVLSGRIMDVRYDPGQRCTVLYRLKLRHAETGDTARELFVAQVCRRDQPLVPRAPGAPRGTADWRRALRTVSVVRPHTGLVVSAFGGDAGLPTLGAALDPAAVRVELDRLWESRGLKVRRIDAQMLAYTPDARAAIDYDLLVVERHTHLPASRRLIGKIHAKKSASRLFAGAWAIWRAANLRIGLAPPVGVIPALGLTLQERVPGVRLGGLAGASSFTSAVRHTARALARFHALDVPLTTWRRAADEAASVRRWGSVLAVLRSDEASRVGALTDRLAGAVEATTKVSGPVHGDFHHTNVLVAPDRRITIIDLDESAYGDPATDVGRFLASLRIPALRVFGDFDGLRTAREAFLEEYLSQRAEDERRVRVFEAACLLTAAASAFRIQRPTWREEVVMLVDEAERSAHAAGVDRATTTVAVPSVQPMVDRRRWLLDDVYMQTVLQAPVHELGDGVTMTGCRARLTSSSQKADRVEFVLTGWQQQRRWKGVLHGIAARDGSRSGRGLAKRLTELQSAMASNAWGPILPKPVAYLSQLSLLVLQLPGGTPFSSLVATTDGAEVADRLARALSAVHRATMSGDAVRSLADELAALKRDVCRLHASHADLHALAAPIAEDIAWRLQSMSERLVPSLRSLQLRDVVCQDRQVGIADVTGVTMAHPLLDVAALLARLALFGCRRDRTAAATAVGDRLRASALDVEASQLADLAPLEASSLVRLACAEARQDGQASTAAFLLQRAEAALCV
jgi:aminoglycoside phosphotransferase (APT) family kinase protein